MKILKHLIPFHNTDFNYIENFKFYFPYIKKFSILSKVIEYFIYVLIYPIIEMVKFLYQLSIFKVLAENYFISEQIKIFGYELKLPYIQIFNSQLLDLIIVTLLIWALSIIINWRMSFIQEINQHSIIEGMRSILYGHLLKLDIDKFTKIETGTMQSIWMMMRHVGGFFQISVNLVKNIILGLVILILIFQFFKVSIIYFSILIILLLLINHIFSNKIFQKSILVSNLNSKSMSKLEELIYAAKLIRLSQKEKIEQKNFDMLHDQIKDNNISLVLISNIARSILQFLTTIIILLFVVYIDYNRISISDIFAFGVLATRLAPIVSDLTKSINYFFEITGILQNLKGILNDNIYNSDSDITNRVIIKQIDNIEFKNIEYKYGNNKVISNANLILQKGKSYCLLGSSGSGKSTLLDIISGFRSTSNGSILVNDNIPLNENSNESYIKNISYLPQETIILNKSIKENIYFLSKDTLQDNINELIKFSELNDLIENNEKGIETVVGNRGNLLSGGQKQRIGISRSLTKPFQVLIFDEATSNIDAITENKIIHNLLRLSKDKIAIFATHRQNLIKYFDSIIIIHKGDIYQFNSLEDFKLTKPDIFRLTIPN